ncbi:MAG: stage III sporulation AC/AD family protein [Oscillospiraceae bacterium]|nr:stage III sporulation AC/AD family protein [Oscillospiraceae bacterium]
MNDITAVSGFCIAGAVLSVLLKQYCKEQSMMISLGVCIIIFAGAVGIISPVLEKTSELFTESGVNEGYIIIVFKAMAICFITQITSDICRDSGENAIASSAELFGRVLIILMSLPFIESLVDIITEFI